VIRTVRAKITFLGIAALVVSLGISLPLELLTNRWEAQQVERNAFIKEMTDLAPAVKVLLAAPGARDLLHSFFASLPRGEELYILNPSGVVVASSNAELEGQSLEEIPHPLPADVKDLLAAATGSPASRTVTSSGRSVPELFVRLDGGDTLLAVVSLQAAVQLQHILLYHTLPLLLFGVGLLGTIFWFGLDRIILKPLGLLSRSAEAVLSLNDESTGIIPSGLIPLDDLGEVLRLQNSMLLKLRENRLRFEQELHRRTFELEVAHRLAGHIDYHTTYQDLVQEVLMHLRKVVDWDVAAGFVVEKGQARVWSRSQVPLSTSATEEVRHWMEEACSSAGGQQLQVLGGLWNSMDWRVVDPGGPKLERIHSHMAFPLQANGSYVGVMILGNSRPNAYADHHARVIRDVLEHGLISVQRIRRLVRAQTKRLESILQNMSVGVLFLDTEGQLMYINRRGEQYLANLQETTDNIGGHWRKPPVLSNLCTLEGPHQSVEVRTAQGSHKRLRINIAPFEADSPEAAGGRILIIEELATEAASPPS
jgi:PAS domain-containing protein